MTHSFPTRRSSYLAWRIAAAVIGRSAEIGGAVGDIGRPAIGVGIAHIGPCRLAILAVVPIPVARAISLVVVPIAPRAIAAIPVVSGIVARVIGAVMTALGALAPAAAIVAIAPRLARAEAGFGIAAIRSEEHTSELQSLMRTS